MSERSGLLANKTEEVQGRRGEHCRTGVSLIRVLYSRKGVLSGEIRCLRFGHSDYVWSDNENDDSQ